jgi:hypothetical protein
MAVLDRYIEALVRTPGAQWITLRSGVAVEMVVAGTSRPVGRSTPSFDQIVAAIAEVATDEQVAQAQASGREISYVGPHGPVMLAVRCRQAQARRGPQGPQGERAQPLRRGRPSGCASACPCPELARRRGVASRKATPPRRALPPDARPGRL